MVIKKFEKGESSPSCSQMTKVMTGEGDGVLDVASFLIGTIGIGIYNSMVYVNEMVCALVHLPQKMQLMCHDRPCLPRLRSMVVSQ